MIDFVKKFLKIDGDDISFVSERREGGMLFKNNTKKYYIKYGGEKLLNEYHKHKKLESLKFPVAKILGLYSNDNIVIYTEEDLGEKVIGIKLYNKEISYEKGFLDIYNLSEKHFNAQKSTLSRNGDINDIKKENYIDFFYNEAKEDDLIDSNLLENLFNKIDKELKHFKYFTLNHGDFNGMNLTTNGVIDIEDSYTGLLGYDLISLVINNYWFVNNGNEKNILFSFNEADINKLFNLHESIFGIDVKDFFNTLFMVRSIWSIADMERGSMEQKNRLIKFKKYTEEYLKGGKLYNTFLKEVKEVNLILDN